ncbi:MAG: ABC transporter permease subunit [Anaerolineae bacterium]|nr:ABC transporter permease subunit [Anaerolineae bacterium]MCK4471302.1 ABC transporter permease subunit [Anaerolineae bacterium]
MNGAKILAIVEKEVADARKNKMIVISMALLPILLVAMVLGTAYFMLYIEGEMGEAKMDEDDLSIIPAELQDMDPMHAFLMLMNDQYLFYFLLIPMMMPVYIAAYSIVGEKETKSLEPLLATPISVWELLVGKSIAAVVPSVVLTWFSFIVLVIGGYFIMPELVFLALIRPVWIVGMALLSPLLALLSVFSGVIVSSRMNDPRAAQQVTGIFVVPIVALSIVVLAGKIFLSVAMVVMAAAVTLALDCLALYFAIKLFQRETILTRWK